MASTRREDILFHAAKLFSERGVAGTTVRDIADEVGILSGSLYHYFGSKDAIVSEIVVAFVEDLDERYEAVQVEGETGRQRLDRMVEVSFDVAVAHPFATEIYQNESALSSLPADSPLSVAVRRAHEYWDSAIALGIEAGEFRSDLDAGYFQRMLRESVWSTVRVHRATLARDSDLLRHNLIAMFLDGFSAGGPGAVARPVAAPVVDSADSGAVSSDAGDPVDPAEFAALRREVRELADLVRGRLPG